MKPPKTKGPSNRKRMNGVRSLAKGNYSILDINIMHGLDNEEANDMFLRLRDRCGSLEAERAAYEWRDISGPARTMVATAAVLHARFGCETLTDDVFAFIRERQYRRYAPGN